MLTARWALGTAMVTGSLFIGAAATASAEPPPPPPPPFCTASDLASAISQTAAGTSVYLGTHPDVNAFFTSLKGLPKDQLREQAKVYLDANPQVRAELQGVRQPSTDFHNRCG